MTRRVVKSPKWSTLDRVGVDFPAMYAVGDVLWVRETWGVDQSLRGVRPLRLHPTTEIYYAADHPNDPASDIVWRPSLFMPRWASRITLEIIAVRVERLQSISAENCLAEGIYYENGSYEADNFTPNTRDRKRVRDFVALWESINAKRGHGWDTNPLVYVIEFKTINKEGGR